MSPPPRTRGVLRELKHPEDQAIQLITEVASSTLESVPRQPDFDAILDRLGQAMGLLSHLAYSVLELQNPDDTTGMTQLFHRGFEAGRETADGIVHMITDVVNGTT